MLWMYDFTSGGFKSQVQMVQKEPLAPFKLFIKYGKCTAQTLIADWLLYSLNGVNATRQGSLFNWLLYSNEVLCAGNSRWRH